VTPTLRIVHSFRDFNYSNCATAVSGQQDGPWNACLKSALYEVVTVVNCSNQTSALKNGAGKIFCVRTLIPTESTYKTLSECSFIGQITFLTHRPVFIGSINT